MNGGVIQGKQAFTLRNTLANKLCVDALHARLRECGTTRHPLQHVSMLCVVLFAPLFGGDAENAMFKTSASEA